LTKTRYDDNLKIHSPNVFGVTISGASLKHEKEISKMKKVLNYINGEWLESTGTQFVDVVNPTTNEVLARTPLSPPCEVDDAARAAAIAWPEWRRTPLEDRIQYLFKLRTLLEDCFDELCIITL